MAEFTYRYEESNILGKIPRPVADVYFTDKEGKELIAFMYIDSGADIILIPRQFGELLGFETEGDRIEEIGGIGNTKIPVIIKKTTIRVGDKTIAARVAWALIEEVPYLLGRLDVFDTFDVLFKQRNKKIQFD